MIGYLASASAAGYVDNVRWFLQGVSQGGYVEGRGIEYRWADFQYDRLPSLAAELVQRRVAVIFSTGSVISALAAKTATATVPIVFANGSDPVQYGLVASLNRPGGNITGVSFINSSLGPKRLELLREILPKATKIAVLVNPKNPNAVPDAKGFEVAARNIGQQVVVVSASSDEELEEAFVNAKNKIPTHWSSTSMRSSMIEFRKSLHWPPSIPCPQCQRATTSLNSVA